MKKFLFCLMTVVALMLGTTMVSAATEDLNYGNWIARENSDGTIKVVGCRALEEYVSDGVLTLPSELDGKTVTSVGGIGSAYNQKFDMFSPELVTKLVFADTIKSVDNYVFEAFVNLTEIVFPNNYDFKLGYSVFGDNEKITDITWASYISNVSEYLGSMTTLTIHEGVSSVNIWEYSALTTLNLPSTITRVDFWRNPNLATVNCPKSFDQICVTKTEDCPKLAIDVHLIPVEGYKAQGFVNGSYKNSGITSITIDAGFLTYNQLKKDTFKDCPNLKGIYIKGESKFTSQDGVLFWEDDLFAYPAGKSYAGDYTVPSFVKCIYVYAFDRCKFTSITIPEDINPKYYWDYSVIESYQDENGEWKNRSIKVMSRIPNTKIRVVKGTPACDSYEDEAIPNWLYIPQEQVEYYLGSVRKISYELNGGVNHPDNPKTHQLGANYVTLKDPTREGYTFLGWRRNDYKSEYVNNTEFINTQEPNDYNYTFTAEWKINDESSFDDVTDPKSYYYEPVYWAVENRITAGYTTTSFAPDMACTRGQVVTFLWRAAGQPEPKSTACSFNDVPSNAYYYKAVLWAVENNITSGLNNTTFAPDQECTRGQIVTFMYRFAGQPSTATTSCAFVDVPADAYYYKAILWAVDNAVTAGYTVTEFAPEMVCTRGQIVTFLYRGFRQ